MSLPTPQQLFPGLEEIFGRWASAMPALVGPAPDGPLRAQVPRWMERVDALTPRASAETRGCLHAALHVLADDLAAAHTLCQDIPTPQGSAWHAVVHRREGDFWNSNYWWRRASGLSWSSTTPAGVLAPPTPSPHQPSRFVDRVEQFHRGAAAAAEAQSLLELQRWEWAVLFLQGFSNALAGE